MLRPRGARCGAARQNAQPGSVTFIQRFGSALNLHLHFHVIVLEGVYLDRTAQGRQPRFVTGEPPTDADIAAVGQKISRRVIRTCATWDTGGGQRRHRGHGV